MIGIETTWEKIGVEEAYLLIGRKLKPFERDERDYKWTSYQRESVSDQYGRWQERLTIGRRLESEGYFFLSDKSGSLPDDPFVVTPSEIVMSPLVAYCVNKSGRPALSQELINELKGAVEYYEAYNPKFFDCMKESLSFD